MTVPMMARAGLWLNLGFVALVVAAGHSLLLWVFGITPGSVPEWTG